VWTDQSGRQEVREWEDFGEPGEVDCRELFECVCRLAGEFGWKERKETKGGRRKRKVRTAGDGPDLRMPTGEAVMQARAYLAGVPGAVEGRGGDAATFSAAAVCVIDFGLSVADALPVLLEWNARCLPAWTVDELLHKLEAADCLDRERGWRVRRRSKSIAVRIRESYPLVYVGVGTAADDRSYIDLPTMRAGTRKVGAVRVLAPELAEVDWTDRKVLLAPASNITTNKREVWSEFYLNELLKEQGVVEANALRLPPKDGRCRTLAEADGVDLEVVEPPANATQAAARAEQAERLARETEPVRKSLPRRRTKLDPAAAFIRLHNVTSLTREVVALAMKEGLSRATLHRALQALSPTQERAPQTTSTNT
jgi:hypothetical protein